MSGETKEWLIQRIELAFRRLEALENDKSRAAVYERDMHKNDIKILSRKLTSLEETVDFLFCERCDRNVGSEFKFGHFDVKTNEISEEDRKLRKCPVINIKMSPVCLGCEGPLIQILVK